MTEPHFRNFLKKFKGDNYKINPFKFEFSYATTKEFSRWWELQYSGHLVNELLLTTAVRNGFEESILNKIKLKLNVRGIFSSLLFCVLSDFFFFLNFNEDDNFTHFFSF
jgi:hypothetical protein